MPNNFRCHRNYTSAWHYTSNGPQWDPWDLPDTEPQSQGIVITSETTLGYLTSLTGSRLYSQGSVKCRIPTADGTPRTLKWCMKDYMAAKQHFQWWLRHVSLPLWAGTMFFDLIAVEIAPWAVVLMWSHPRNKGFLWACSLVLWWRGMCKINPECQLMGSVWQLL